ncbi:hypothetical protein GCM10010170_055500 [Dactylosporangium salmoneum]|uniref:Uncharacterized protein n=1 Tax=Dactylosporangium salmoneum TaxID=53361 RepID=A0ABP5TTY2_9ACTN
MPAGMESWRKPAVFEKTSTSNGVAAAARGICCCTAGTGSAEAGVGRVTTNPATSGSTAAMMDVRRARL